MLCLHWTHQPCDCDTLAVEAGVILKRVFARCMKALGGYSCMECELHTR